MIPLNTSGMVSLPVEQEKLQLVLQYYFRVKNLIMLNEELDDQLKTNLQIFNELRSCLDHLLIAAAIRAPEVVRRSLPDGDSLTADDNEAEKQLNSAIKHLERALFDACDTTSMICRLEVADLNAYALDDVECKLPGYTTEICPYVDEQSIRIAQLRQGRTAQQEEKLDNIDEYYGIVLKLLDYAKRAREARHALRREGTPRVGETPARPSISMALVLLAGLIIGAAAMLVFIWFSNVTLLL